MIFKARFSVPILHIIYINGILAMASKPLSFAATTKAVFSTPERVGTYRFWTYSAMLGLERP